MTNALSNCQWVVSKRALPRAAVETSVSFVAHAAIDHLGIPRRVGGLLEQARQVTLRRSRIHRQAPSVAAAHVAARVRRAIHYLTRMARKPVLALAATGGAVALAHAGAFSLILPSVNGVVGSGGAAPRYPERAHPVAAVGALPSVVADAVERVRALTVPVPTARIGTAGRGEGRRGEKQQQHGSSGS